MKQPLTHEEQTTRAANLADGVAKRLSGKTLMLDNITETDVEVEAKLRAYVRDRENVLVAKAVYEASVAKADAADLVIIPYMGTLTKFVRATFGNAADILVDFGIEPVKTRTPLTAEEKVAANAKREATRTARGVVGSRKRQTIHGNVTGVEVIPVTAPATPAPAAPPQAAPSPQPSPAAPTPTAIGR